ncbi:MAG: hypothetical protein GX221_03365 [Candidatus Riflebacteria bacterium]|nr:hypothetical protein [Candidatus Riflebacteria bacterium]
MKLKYMIFCEDIRHEVGGKFTLVGVISNNLWTQEFPLVIPKLCLFMEWEGVTKDATVALNIIPPKGLKAPDTKPIMKIGHQPGINARSIMALAGFPFQEPGEYTFSLECDGKTIASETIKVEKYEPSKHVN